MATGRLLAVGVLLIAAQSESRHFEEQSFVQTNLTFVAQLVSNGMNAFGIDMYKMLSSENRNNLIFSPFSISTGISMLYMMTDGLTSEEITKTLYLPSDSDRVAEGFHDILKPINNGSVIIGNRAYVDSNFPLKQSYLNKIKKELDAGSENVNFSESEKARVHINKWVSKMTKGKVPTLFKEGSITGDTKIALVNTLYFKGAWHSPFNAKLTREREFFREDGSVSTVSTMSVEASFKYAEIPSLDLKAISMPYTEGRQKMIIIMPNKPDGLKNLEKLLTQDRLRDEILSVMSYQNVRVRLPMLNLDETISLKNALKSLGIKKVFNFAEADFSKAVSVRGLEVSSVQHRACLEVDEQGTVGGAATGIVLNLRSGLMVTPEFIANHPFIFGIIDGQTDVMLFMGRYMGPS